jgi:DNA-binding response OmpR family regulator
MKILLTEDEEVLRMLIVDTLEENYEIDEAVNGEEALAKIKENDYELLLVDYMMPKMTGLELIKKIRNDLENKHMKILMLTAKTENVDQNKIKLAGADYFLAKPFSPIQLVELIGEIMNE